MANTLQESALFCIQATLGANYNQISAIASTGINTWLDNELAQAPSNTNLYLNKTNTIWAYFKSALVTRYTQSVLEAQTDKVLPYWFYFKMAWWDINLSTTTELVRHRVAQALSEILVISYKSNLELDALGLASFYDLLYKHAFNSYEDLLYDVSLHPCMGVFLTHMNNPKEDTSLNIHPDENYAREIMQLFSIGLERLNLDGTKRLDIQGKSIATYDNNDIKELAKVFTGLKAQHRWDVWNGNGASITLPDDNAFISQINMTEPMVFQSDWHDSSSKTLVHNDAYPNGKVLAAGQSGVDDLRATIKHLVEHESAAPFICKKLIQQLVCSNPSKAYIERVARVFRDNTVGLGNGTGNKVGDLKAVVRAILLDTEAKQPKKMKAPVLRATQVLRAFNVSNTSNKLWVLGDILENSTKHHILASPTVFNFYLSDFAPHGAIANANEVAPEFGIHDAATSIGYVNMMYDWFYARYYLSVSTILHNSRKNAPEFDIERLKTQADDVLKLDFSAELALVHDHNALIDRMSLILTGSSLATDTKADILASIEGYASTPGYEPLWVVQSVAFLICISADFTILKAAS